MSVAITSLLLGLFASTNPCILPLYPGYLAYLSGSQGQGHRSRYALGVFVLLGVLVMMLALGGVIALLSISVGRALSIIIPIADLLIIGLGILLLLGLNPFTRMSQVRVPIVSHPFVNAFIYGLLYGPISMPCTGPLVVGIFLFSITIPEALSKFAIFFWYGVGFGLPLLVISFLSGALQRQITQLFARHERIINTVAGIILVAIGIYSLWVNADLILAYIR